MSRDDALTMRYVEHSTHALLGSSSSTATTPTRAMRAFETAAGPPRPELGRTQSLSGAHTSVVARPNHVCTPDSARLTPLRSPTASKKRSHNLRRRRLLYGGQLTKKPIHPDWENHLRPSTPYTLRQLATIHTPRQATRRPDRAAGLGRNVNNVRHRPKMGLPPVVAPTRRRHRRWLMLVPALPRHQHPIRRPCPSSRSAPPPTPSANGSGATSTRSPTAPAKHPRQQRRQGHDTCQDRSQPETSPSSTRRPCWRRSSDARSKAPCTSQDGQPTQKQNSSELLHGPSRDSSPSRGTSPRACEGTARPRRGHCGSRA
ncbi:hypothetical protein GS933_18345 [Rhodococcus hoagii]|nr:hypothetical protein [Prescottella equi]